MRDAAKAIRGKVDPRRLARRREIPSGVLFARFGVPVFHLHTRPAVSVNLVRSVLHRLTLNRSPFFGFLLIYGVAAFLGLYLGKSLKEGRDEMYL